MSDDDGEQSAAEKRGEELAPKVRDLAAEITPTSGQEADDEDRIEDGLLERRDEAADVVVDGETATAFWAAVVYVNVGLLLVSLGPMLALFRGRVQIGAALVVLGAVALYRAYTVYKRYMARDEERGPGDDNTADEPDRAGSDDERPDDED